MKKSLLIVCVIILNSVLAISQIIIIPTDQLTIQDGINIAQNGDTILVLDGTYYENINMLGKEITLASEFLTDGDDSHIINTIIDGSQPSNPDQASVITLVSGESTNTLIFGLTIKNGEGTSPDPFGFTSGGGIYCIGSGVTLSNSKIADNQLTGNDVYGGGLFCYDSEIIIKNCMFFNNHASRGGGVFSQNSNIGSYNNDFQTNEAGDIGGGFYFANNNNSVTDIELIVEGNSFIGNNCVETTGGMVIRNTADNGTSVDAVIMETEMYDNSAAQRSGLNIRGDNLLVVVYNSSFSYNEADNYAAGVSLADQSAGIFYNCLFHSNVADLLGGGYNSGGVSVWSGAEAEFQNCVFADNAASFGSGLTVGGDGIAMAINSIFWNNSPDQIALTSWENNGGTLDISYCNIEGGTESIDKSPESVLNTGNGIINSDPLFLNSGDKPYSIVFGSPCIDVGTTDTSGLEIPLFDIIYNVRIWDGNDDGTAVIDMGAYEYNSEPLGVFDIDANANKAILSAYPNPAISEITFSVNNSTESIQRVEIININGKVVQLHRNINSKESSTCDISALTTGMYICRLNTTSNSYSIKFMVK